MSATYEAVQIVPGKSQELLGRGPWVVALRHPSGDGTHYAARVDDLTQLEAELVAAALNTAAKLEA